MAAKRVSKTPKDCCLYSACLPFSREGLFTLEAENVAKSRLDGMRDSLVFLSGRVVDIPCVRSFRCGSGRRTSRCHSCLERRVRGCRGNATAH
jgi:hypothetical protein